MSQGTFQVMLKELLFLIMANRRIGLNEYVKEVGKRVVTEVLWPTVKGHIDYCWFFWDNIQGLRGEIDNLERDGRKMGQRIEEARLRGESATPDVRNWLHKSTQKLEEGMGFLQGCNDFKAWNIILRYLRGKSANKMAQEIAKLRSEGNLTRISDPPPPPSMGSNSEELTMDFESRRCIEEDIIKSLNDDHVHIIAICGAGGVGKTTMVQRIEHRVRREKLFDEVVAVVVSQQIDMFKTQKEIDESLGLTLREETLAARAHKIRTRLLDSKRKLVIFDDVWKSFNLKDVGVPLGNGFEECKIILTSRLKDVCEEMDADKVFQIEVLDKEEAWRLFREKSGECVDNSDLRPIAEAIAAECKGLPIALVPVGKALKNKGIRTWEDSLLQLRRANPMNFPKVLEDVYKPLKLSYYFLETESEKSLFLLCCLFPEDFGIPIELLTLYSIGLGILEGIGNIDEGRNRTHHLVERLKSRFLLIDGRWGDFVKMHDVVRDVAIFIGSKEKQGFLKSLEVFSMDSPSLDSSPYCRWMSINISIPNAKIPVGSDFPNLHFWMILESDNDPFSEELNNDIDFEGMEELKVLSYSQKNLRSLPPTLKLLKQLRTLHLIDFALVKDISAVGELVSLEILNIYNCTSIEELPADIGRLNRLRVLEFMSCGGLKRIAEGALSSLVGLEELKIVDSFDQWGAKVNKSDKMNASLSELESLPNLTCLEIDISDSNLVAQKICLSQQLVRYRIRFRGSVYVFDDMKYERNISLNLPGDIIVGNWIHPLVRNTHSLQLTGDGSNYFNLDEIESLRKLMFTECSTVKKINCQFPMLEQLYLRELVEVESIVDGTILEGSNSFKKLELLDVSNMPKLVHLWKSLNQNVSLNNLESIFINICPNLRSLFPLETVRSLVQLRRLEIERCDTIEQVFWNETDSNIEDEIIEFPRLTELKIIDCPNLMTKIGKCPNLKTIQLYTFNALHHLLSSCCTRTWNTQLQKLLVSSCHSIEEILWDEIEDEVDSHIIFAKLEELELSDLPCLTTFYRGVESIKFPKLEGMTIGYLPRLNSLAPMDSEPTHDDRSLHLFCNQKVEIPCLNTLCINNLPGIISKIWCRLVTNSFFHNLKNLDIYDVNGIRNLMSSSIAKNLANLRHLSIQRCQEMVEVIEDDIEFFVTSLFPKLNYIGIRNLHKLKSFCQWKHALEFPSLRSVRIVDCPGMETFTLGSLSTPYYTELSVNDEPFEKKDLNGGIRDHFMTGVREGRKRKGRRRRREEHKRQRI